MPFNLFTLDNYTGALHTGDVPVEVFRAIIQYCTAISLCRLSQANRTAWILVNSEFLSRQKDLISAYVPPSLINDCLTLFRHHNVVISGSSALQFLDPCFIANDLDLCVSSTEMDSSHYSALLQFLVSI